MSFSPTNPTASAMPGSRSITGGPESPHDTGPTAGARQRITQAAAYPRQSHLVLGALPSAVPSARLHARLVLAEWDLKELAETAELIVSELVTNAVHASAGLQKRHSGLPVIQLRLHADHECVLIEIWDADERMPEARHPGPDAEHGRGLLLVEALSEGWGTFRSPGHPGKVVWARCVSHAKPHSPAS